MKKTVKILSTILLVLMLVMSVANIALADTKGDIKDIAGGSANAKTGSITNVGKSIVSIVRIVGISAAVIILLVIGIKYMVGSASEKAEYKKTMIPYIIGAVLLFAASTIVTALYDFGSTFGQ